MAKKPDSRRAIKLSRRTTAEVLKIQNESPWMGVLSFSQIGEALVRDGLRVREQAMRKVKGAA